MRDFLFLLMCDFFCLKKETWDPFGQNCIITCILSIRSRSLKGTKLHGQFSHIPNENILTRPSYSTRLFKTFNMISRLVCVFYFVAYIEITASISWYVYVFSYLWVTLKGKVKVFSYWPELYYIHSKHKKSPKEKATTTTTRFTVNLKSTRKKKCEETYQ